MRSHYIIIVFLFTKIIFAQDISPIGKLKANVVRTANIVDGAIDSSKIADSSITSAKISTGGVEYINLSQAVKDSISSGSSLWSQNGTEAYYNDKVAIGRTTAGNSLFHVGDILTSSAYPGVSLARTWSTNNTNAHGFVDGSTITSGEITNYASFDAFVNYNGSGWSDHYIAFQNRSILTADTLNYFRGFHHQPVQSGGFVDKVIGFYARGITGTTDVNQQFGLYIDNNFTAADTNWAIYASSGYVRLPADGVVIGNPGANIPESGAMLHIYNGSSGANFSGAEFVAEDDGNVNFILATPITGVGVLGFADAGGAAGSINYYHSTDDMILTAKDNFKVNADFMGIGMSTTVNPYHDLSIYRADPEVCITNTAFNLSIGSDVKARDTSAIFYKIQNTGFPYMHFTDENGHVTFMINDSNVTIAGNLSVAGKITATGGVDPPYVSYSLQNRESIKRLSKDVKDPIMQFWNEDKNQMEIYDVTNDTFYILDNGFNWWSYLWIPAFIFLLIRRRK